MGWGFYHFFQAVWEADPYQVPIQVSKMDVTDEYHRVTVTLSQVGVFAYIVPLALEDEGCIICIYLVLPMVWVESPKFFRVYENAQKNLGDSTHTIGRTK